MCVRQIAFSGMLILLFPLILNGDVEKDNGSTVRRLLDMAAPAPDWEKAAPPFAQGQVPADDASLDVLLAFWGSEETSDQTPLLLPSEKVRARLLEAAFQKPDRIPSLLPWFPETPEVFDRLKAVYDRSAAEPDSYKELRQIIHDWLMMRSRHFRQDLVEAAARACWAESYVEDREAVEALARLDWAAAEPLLKRHADGPEPHVATLANTIRYTHYVESGDNEVAAAMRTGLQALVEDKKAPAFSRDRAFEALMGSDWEGRDQWFLSLFSDATLMKCGEGFFVYSPLCAPVAQAPDRWIPIIARMVGDKDRAVHNNAVTCLIQFHLDQVRQDALKPLLPWLSDPKWSSAADRLRLVQSLDRVDLPESVPGLLWVLQNEGGYERAGAAEALGHYRAKEAGPALKEAFEKNPGDRLGRALVVAMLACDALNDEDIAKAVEAYAREKVAQSHKSREAQPEPTVQIELGRHLTRLAAERQPAAERLLARAEVLRVAEPEIADALLAILSKWTAPAVDRYLIARMRVSADLPTVLVALQRAELLRKNVRPELLELTRDGGAVAGVAAAVLGEPEACRQLLRGGDKPAQQLLLACARLLRTSLPVGEVGLLMSEKPAGLLALAAERYLESEDGPEARKLVLARHPGEARILGARMGFDPGHYTFGAFDRTEERLREEIRRPDGPDLIIALLTEGYWGNEGQWILRVKGDTRILSVECGNGKRLSRPLAEEEFANLMALISEQKIDDLPPLNTMVCDGLQVEYVRLTREGGRRVFMNNPGVAGTVGTAYDLLTRRFWDLSGNGPLQVHYAFQDSIVGSTVVLCDQENGVQAVWKKDDDLRVLVGEDSWRAVRQGRLDEGTEEPDACPVLGGVQDIVNHKFFDMHLNRWAWQVRAGEDVIRAARNYYGGGEVGGLWRCRQGTEPRKVCPNAFARPVVTPDGLWAVAPRSDRGWAEPHPIVRVNLATGEQCPIDVGPVDFCEAVCYLPAHKKVLISLANRRKTEETNEDAAIQAERLVAAAMGVRGANRGATDKTEFRLLDPATGRSEVVQGNFGPLEQMTYRPLQITRNADEAWAAVPDEQGTRLGRYDMKRFVFTPLLTIAEVRFDSMDMWVDEAEGAVYVAVNGDLLRIPLPKEGSASR